MAGHGGVSVGTDGNTGGRGTGSAPARCLKARPAMRINRQRRMKGMCVEMLTNAIERDLNLAHAQIEDDEFFYSSLPLCVISAVFYPRVKMAAVRNTVAHYCEHYHLPLLRQDLAQVPPRDQQQPVGALIRNIEAVGSERFATEIVHNRQRTSTRSGILKAEAVLRFARVLFAHGIEFFQDIERAVHDHGLQIQTEIRAIPGQSKGISLRFFYALIGEEQFIIPTLWLHRYLRRVCGHEFTDAQVRETIARVVDNLRGRYPHLTPRRMDNFIWNFERARENAH